MSNKRTNESLDNTPEEKVSEPEKKVSKKQNKKQTSKKSQSYTRKQLKRLVDEEIKRFEHAIAYQKEKGEKHFKTLLYPARFDGVRSHFEAIGYETEEYDDNTSDCRYSYLIIKWK